MDGDGCKQLRMVEDDPVVISNLRDELELLVQDGATGEDLIAALDRLLARVDPRAEGGPGSRPTSSFEETQPTTRVTIDGTDFSDQYLRPSK